MITTIQKLLEGASFLEITRENEDHLASEVFENTDYLISIRGTGIIKIIPKKTNSKNSYLISTAIHGNETAPIEIVDAIISDFFSGNLHFTSPTLIIFGSPKSMNIAKRFVDFNLNRLFAGAWKDISKCYETQRAKEIEDVCYEFKNEFCNLSLCHYDLHTAIKPSKHEKFAIYPFSNKRKEISMPQIAFVQDLGCDAVLFSKTKSTTFSCFSANELEAESFTVELGKVWPFGQNPMLKFEKAKTVLRDLLSGNYHEKQGPTKELSLYDVHSSIIKQGEDFKFLYEGEVENFTTFTKETPLYFDINNIYKTQESDLALIFPNESVEIGQRAGLLVKKRS